MGGGFGEVGGIWFNLMFQRRVFGIVRVIERGVYFKGWAKGQGKRSECVTQSVVLG